MSLCGICNRQFEGEGLKKTIESGNRQSLGYEYKGSQQVHHSRYSNMTIDHVVVCPGCISEFKELTQFKRKAYMLWGGALASFFIIPILLAALFDVGETAMLIMLLPFTVLGLAGSVIWWQGLTRFKNTFSFKGFKRPIQPTLRYYLLAKIHPDPDDPRWLMKVSRMGLTQETLNSITTQHGSLN